MSPRRSSGSAWALAVWILGSPLGTVSGSSALQRQPPAATIDELTQRLVQTLGEQAVPGAGLALVSAEEVLWADGLGMADGAARKPATADTLFRLGSVSKSIVSLAILMLVEEGRLELDAPARELLPQIEFDNPWSDSDPVRVVHLLEHTSGFDDIHLVEYAHDLEVPVTLSEGLAFHPHSRRARWRPGTRYSYSNSGPAVAARLVESLTGQTFEQFSRLRIFDPLEMATATYFEANGLAKGYASDGVTEAPYWHILFRPAGALNASPREMANFVRMLINRGSLGEIKLVEPASVERMETPTSTLAARAGLTVGAGLGIFSSIHEGFVIRGHAGGMHAFVAEYGYLREAGLGYVFMLNSADAIAFRRFRREILGFLTRELEPRPLDPIELSSERLRELTGHYEFSTPRPELARFLVRLVMIRRVRSEDGQLRARTLTGAAQRLVAVSERSFRTEDEPVATTAFVRDSSGELLMQVATGSGAGTYRAISGARVWLRIITASLCLLSVMSSLLSALAWVPRKLFGRLHGVSHLSIRVWPLLAGLALASAVGVAALALDDPIGRLGQLTPWSLSLWLLLWVFALCSLAGCARVVRAIAARNPCTEWLHPLTVALAELIVLGYLARWGIVGLRTWSY